MHPYKSFPAQQFWSHAVSRNFDAKELANVPVPLIKKSDRIVSAGSCFAANLIPYLENYGFTYLRTEYTSPVYTAVPAENMSYGKFSAGYGNIYTARQMLQLLRRCLGYFSPQEDRWVYHDRIIDPFRPGLRYYALSEKEFDLLTSAHLAATAKAFSMADVFIFTLGLTEAWISTLDGAVFPACPGTVAGSYDASRHAFINFSVDDIISDLEQVMALLREWNPSTRVILTVSPVPLVATAEQKHVLTATVFSKSVLRVAAEYVCQKQENMFYFPAYEIITGPQAPHDFFEQDRRTVSPKAVDTVMEAFLSLCEAGSTVSNQKIHQQINIAQKLSQTLTDIECEEAAQNRIIPD